MKKYILYKKSFLFFLLFSLVFCHTLLLHASEPVTEEETEAESTTENENTQSLQLSATVPSTKAAYYVEIPSEVSFGAISTTKDTSYDYEIHVTAEHFSSQESLTIASVTDFPMVAENNKDSFPCYNSFQTHTFTKSDDCVGTLTILKEDAASAPRGSYSGSLQFQITYQKGKENTPSDTPASTVNVDKKITGASVSGLTSYTTSHKEGIYTFTMQQAQSKEHQNGIAAIASLISAGGQKGTTSFYDFSLTCDTGTEIKEISDTNDCVFEIYIPITASDVGTITAYRHHEGTTSLMQLLSKRPTSDFVDNTYYYDLTTGYICFYSSRFSVFAAHMMPASSTTTTTTSSSTSSSVLDVTTETNFTASVSLRKSTDFNATSMCDPLFYKQADMVVNADTTKLTLYVIDPIPNYSSEGTPLSDITFTYNGTSYSASIDNSNKVTKSYSAASGFISSAGNYSSSSITVSLPTAAIKASADKALTCSAYINAVMKCTQSFYVVLTDFEKGTSATAASTTTTTTKKAATTAKVNNLSQTADQTTVSDSATASPAASTRSSSRKTSSKTSKEEETTLEEDEVALTPTLPADGLTDDLSDDTDAPGTYGYVLVTDAAIQAVFYLLAVILVCIGIIFFIEMEKKHEK